MVVVVIVVVVVVVILCGSLLCVCMGVGGGCLLLLLLLFWWGQKDFSLYSGKLRRVKRGSHYSNCPRDQTVTASNGKTCAVVTWSGPDGSS